MGNKIEIPIMAIQLPETSEFSERFNYVGKLFWKSLDETLPEDERKKWGKIYEDAKLCLEQGWPIARVEIP